MSKATMIAIVAISSAAAFLAGMEVSRNLFFSAFSEWLRRTGRDEGPSLFDGGN